MKKMSVFFSFLLLSFLVLQNVYSQSPNMPSALDTPNDSGKSISLKWETPKPAFEIKEIRVLRSESQDGGFSQLSALPPEQTTFVDKNVEDNKPYFYQVVFKGVGKKQELLLAARESAISRPQWFNTELTSLLIIVLFFLSIMIYFIETGKQGKKYYVRKIAGLDAIDEAIGRATEMGKPVLYVPGIRDMDNVQTLAGLNILGMVAKKVAEFDTPMYVPTNRSMVMTTAKEVVREAYISAGRPDAFVEKNVYYISDEQFGFVAGVNGLLVREKPAACFYLGPFYAESLILAEIGNSVGAIQIAGTAESSQIPFFIAACDYTLIGEELFAASAYLSQDPREIGSLKGQDVGKLAAMIIIGIGTISATISSIYASPTFELITKSLIKFFTA